jgi:hypothetical protein
MEANPARHFWERAILVFTGEIINSVRFEKGGTDWHLFHFESKHV